MRNRSAHRGGAVGVARRWRSIGLIHPEQLGPNRPGPTGYSGQPLGIDGLYLGNAGCHGGPGITFIPGYNAAHAALGN